MNRTFRAERGQGEGGEELTQEQMEQLLSSCRKDSRPCADELQQLMEQMAGQGMEPNGKLGQAGEAMGRAGSQLGEGARHRCRRAELALGSVAAGRAGAWRSSSPTSPARARAMAALRQSERTGLSPMKIRSAGRGRSVPTSERRSRFPTRSIRSAPARFSTRSGSAFGEPLTVPSSSADTRATSRPL